MKKIFGGIDLSWKKVIIGAIIAGAYTALMAIIPQLLYTSFIGFGIVSAHVCTQNGRKSNVSSFVFH